MIPESLITPTISSTEAVKLYANLPEVVQAWLAGQGSRYGILPSELLMKVPENLLDNPVEIFKFIKSKDISHIIATSKGGSPNNFKNWIFENASVNRSRQADPMGLEEYLQAQIDNKIESFGIDFGTPDPGTPGFTREFGDAFGLDSINQATEMESVGEEISKLSGYYMAPKPDFPGEFTPISLSGEAGDVLQETLTDIGIPATYVVLRGINQVFPFLKSVDWKQFKTSCKYRFSVVNRALKAFRDGGWKEAVKAIVMGFLVAAFPPISYLLASIGLTGVTALGTRWLANNYKKLPKGVASALQLISKVLKASQEFLKKVLVFFERIVDVVVDKTTKAVKSVISSSQRFVNQVFETTKLVAKELVQSVKKSTAKVVNSIGKKLSSWVFSWFGQAQFA